MPTKARSKPRVLPAKAGTTRVAIIGAGRGGTALMEIFANDPLVQIIGVAEIRDSAPGLKLAKQLSIPIIRDFHELLEMPSVDLVIDVTGNPDVEQALATLPRSDVAIIGGAIAKFMWQLIEARIRATTEIEQTLNRYQSLYRLYVKEEAESAVNEERTRIACEMHDGLVQTLVGLNYKLDLCRQLIREAPQQCSTTMSETKAQLKQAIEEARQTIFNLRSGAEDKLQLIPALTNYLKSYETRNHIRTKLTVSGDEGVLHPKTKIFLFRIAQEALNNVKKHARASRVSVQLSMSRASLTAKIADNGVGFDVEAVSKDPQKWDHFGLRGIMERARLVGGEARIESTKGRGTRVTVKVPLAQNGATRNGKN